MSEQGADRPYCRPLCAGSASETGAVCRRIGRLITALDTELTLWVVGGAVLDDVAAWRRELIERLEAEGYTLSYAGGERMQVRPPGHKRPFGRATGPDRAGD